MKITISYAEALDRYFGGVKGFDNQSLPFTCKCGRSYTEIIESSGSIKKPIMGISDVWSHIRKTHRETIRNKNK